MDHISDISNYSVNFTSGQSVALGKNALLSTKRAYKRYLLRYPPYTIWEPMELSGASVSEPYSGEKSMQAEGDQDIKTGTYKEEKKLN